MFNRLTAVTLSLIVAAPTVTATRQAPQNCARIAEQFDRDTRVFTAEAERQNLDFIKQLGLDRITGDLKDRLKEHVADSAPAQVAQFIHEKFESAKSARELLQSGRDAFEAFSKCIGAPRGSCDLYALGKTFDAIFQKYLDSLLENAGAGEAKARVDKARDLLHTYLDRTMNISRGTMQAMAECTAPFSRQARVQMTETATPARTGATGDGTTAIPEPTSKPVDPAVANDPANGGGNGLLWTGIGAAGLGYALYEYMPKNGSGGGNCARPTVNVLTVCSSQGGSSAACVNARNDWGTYCRCTGASGFNTGTGSCQ